MRINRGRAGAPRHQQTRANARGDGGASMHQKLLHQKGEVFSEEMTLPPPTNEKAANYIASSSVPKSRGPSPGRAKRIRPLDLERPTRARASYPPIHNHKSVELPQAGPRNRGRAEMPRCQESQEPEATAGANQDGWNEGEKGGCTHVMLKGCRGWLRANTRDAGN